MASGSGSGTPSGKWRKKKVDIAWIVNKEMSVKKKCSKRMQKRHPECQLEEETKKRDTAWHDIAKKGEKYKW